MVLSAKTEKSFLMCFFASSSHWRVSFSTLVTHSSTFKAECYVVTEHDLTMDEKQLGQEKKILQLWVYNRQGRQELSL